MLIISFHLYLFKFKNFNVNDFNLTKIASSCDKSMKRGEYIVLANMVLAYMVLAYTVIAYTVLAYTFQFLFNL